MVSGKFQDLLRCVDGSERARQPFRDWSELWIFTGTRCNLVCNGCYTESSPRNASFHFITLEQAARFLEEARELGIPKICYTGGEPFYNPDFPAILERTIALGFDCLVLTNLTKPYESRGRALVLEQVRQGRPLHIRASLDHPDRAVHDEHDLDEATIARYPVPDPSLDGGRSHWFETGFNRGKGSFERTVNHLLELARDAGTVSVAGRAPSGVTGKLFHAYAEETEGRFRAFFRESGLPGELPLKIFPDIGARRDADVPEITEHRCRTLIPPSVFDGLMCNVTRMVAVPATADGKPNDTPLVFPCTIVPDNPTMALGRTLRESATRDTYLADPRCYRFCIAGGASCSES